jgi:hypothetical protein
MRYDELMGDDFLGEDLIGDEMLGEDGEIGDEMLGDELVGEDMLGDDLGGHVELMGEDFLGDDLGGTEIVGGFRRKPRRRPRVSRRMLQYLQGMRNLRQMKKRAILARRMANAKVVVEKKPTVSRTQSLGFNAEVGPGETLDITVRPAVTFSGTRLSVASSIAPNFVIEDIKVGRKSQFVTSGPQSAESFKDTSTTDNLHLDTCDTGTDIILKVRNVTGTASQFRATFFGDVVE